MKIFKRNDKQQLLEFNVGDKVDVYNILTSERAYAGIISSISDGIKKDSNGLYLRMATIISSDGSVRENAMGTAKKVN
jgi:hypothetical protein